MKTNGYRRGSVLMEFLIVFPIYLILFAGTVAIGDMLVHSNRLVSADRVSAFRVDGHSRNGLTLSRLSGWDLVQNVMYHPGIEVADNGAAQDQLTESRAPHYADATGPWSVCSAVAANDTYRPLAGGTIGQLMSARMLLGGQTGGTLDALAGGASMRSKGTDGNFTFYTLKRRDGYWQRIIRREGYAEFIRSDSTNWRDRKFVSRLLRTQGGTGRENWRLEVSGEGWHTADTINGSAIRTTCSEAYGTNISDYQRFGKFEEISY